MPLTQTNKRWFQALVLLLLVGVAGWFGYSRWYVPKATGPQSHLIQGQVEVVFNDNTGVSVKGVHVLDANPHNSDYNHPTLFKVTFDANTTFVKTVWYMPSKAELANTNGVWYPDKLRKDTQAGSVADFTNTEGLLVTIKTTDNTINTIFVTASEVDYVQQVYPR